MTRLALSLAVVCLIPSLALAAKQTDAEKAKKAAEKKLDSFEKTYDVSKDLSRKSPEKLDKDIAEVDEALSALSALDAAAATELAPRREQLVSKVKEAVAGATGAKAAEVFEKHFAKTQEAFDPEKKKVLNIDAATIKRAKDELTRDIEKIEASQRAPYEAKRDALFAKLAEDVTRVGLAKQRETVIDVPVVKAEPGAEVIGPMAPTWCDGVAAAVDNYSNYHVGSVAMADVSGGSGLVMAVVFSCLDPEFEPRMRNVAAWRQALSNAYGLTAATNERLMKLGAKLAIAKDLDKQRKEMCANLPALTTGTAEARYSRTLERTALSCPGASNDRSDLGMGSIDVPNGLSTQLAAAALANRLTTQGFHSADGKLTGFAVANAVITFDTAAFEKELAAMQLNELGTVIAIETFFGQAQAMRKLEVEAKARNAAVLIDAPKKGAQAFIAALAKNQPAIDLALALEDQKRANGGLKGCAAKVYPSLATAMKGEKAPLDELRIDGLLAYTLTLCGQNDPDAPAMHRVFGYFAERSTAVRGPFTAAYLALLEAHNSSSGGGSSRGSGGEPSGGRGAKERGGGSSGGFDPSAKRGGAGDSKGPFVPDSNPIEPPELNIGNTINLQTIATGVVKGVETKGALTTITFRTEHYMVPVLECHETNKIDRITSDGTILYRSSCKKVGEREETATNQPITVPTYAANGVSAGSFLLYESAPVNDDVQGQPHRGWVVEAYESKARQKRTSLFGLATH